MFNIFADTMMTATRNADWPAPVQKTPTGASVQPQKDTGRFTLRHWLRGTRVS